MSKLQKKYRKNMAANRVKRAKGAEQKVFQWLEDRWKDELKGHPIPAKHRAVMRQDPGFRFLVAKVLTGAGLHAPDLDVTPVQGRDEDGTPRSLFLEEMGGDPRRYLCTDCGDEDVDREGARCADCVELYPEE